MATKSSQCPTCERKGARALHRASRGGHGVRDTMGLEQREAKGSSEPASLTEVRLPLHIAEPVIGVKMSL